MNNGVDRDLPDDAPDPAKRARGSHPWRAALDDGCVIPALPLALDDEGRWSERHQRAVVRYYMEAGAGGLAAGVHTTQFAIREHGLYQPLLRLVAETLQESDSQRVRSFVGVAGVCGMTAQAIDEATLARELGYHAGLLSTTALRAASEAELLKHCRSVAEVIPVFGFCLQPAVGGRVLSLDYWRRFCEIDNVVAIKIAAFNRYQTLDVIRAVIESGRDDIALYTGNDDNILVDLLTPFEFGGRQRHFAGGLLGQWAVWTRDAVETFHQLKQACREERLPIAWLRQAARLTDANAAVFDAAHEFAGCIAGVNEVLRRQGLLPSSRCLDPEETLSPGQARELDRVSKRYTAENRFIAERLDDWLR